MITRGTPFPALRKSWITLLITQHASPFRLRWQSALFRELDWTVWGLIYRSGMNTWMWSSAIFHRRRPHPSDRILSPLPRNRFSPEQALRRHVGHYSPCARAALTHREISAALTSDFCWSIEFPVQLPNVQVKFRGWDNVVIFHGIINTDALLVSLKHGSLFFRRSPPAVSLPIPFKITVA